MIRNYIKNILTDVSLTIKWFEERFPLPLPLPLPRAVCDGAAAGAAAGGLCEIDACLFVNTNFVHLQQHFFISHI